MVGEPQEAGRGGPRTMGVENRCFLLGFRLVSNRLNTGTQCKRQGQGTRLTTSLWDPGVETWRVNEHLWHEWMGPLR